MVPRTGRWSIRILDADLRSHRRLRLRLRFSYLLDLGLDGSVSCSAAMTLGVGSISAWGSPSPSPAMSMPMSSIITRASPMMTAAAPRAKVPGDLDSSVFGPVH